MKHLFLVNPVAGKQKPEEKLRLINEAIDRLPAEQRSRDEFEIYVTEAPMDACRHIRETAADGAELRVYACGGDGTLNECPTWPSHTFPVVQATTSSRCSAQARTASSTSRS